MLELREVRALYGNVLALDGVSMTVNRGEIVALLGANGAGKTSTLRSVIGLLGTRQGSITFEGDQIENRSTVEIVRRGISMVFEGRRLFPELTVKENLVAGGFLLDNSELLKSRLSQMCEMFPRLAERQSQLAGSLSGGEQQMLAIARALMSSPALLLMDEPSMGLAPKIVDDVFRVLESINSRGTTVLLVEQNARRALEVASRAYVLETGKVALSGTATELLSNEAVRSAYLGM
jgi:branched-chain amino acid transport system ATP-binding protein